MKKKTEKEMKSFLQDSELNVIQARNKITNTGNMLYGIMDCLVAQNIITPEANDMIKRRLQIIKTASTEIEIEFYKLKQKIEQ